MSPVTPALRKGLHDLRRRLELGDLVILLYVAAFVRQYLWPVGGAAAWALTALLAALVWLWHVRAKEETTEGTTPAFWVVVGLPLVFFYALRAALPDMSWDVLDYRLVNAERALRGWPLIEGDFFPVRFPFNPAPDMVTGIARHALGYRLGTVVNLAVLLWAGTILEKLLRPFVERAWPRALCVLLLLLTEHLLFEVNNYMVDLLALPLVLEATRLALSTPEDLRRQRSACVRVGLYLGAALAFKLTNLAFALPILLLCAYRVWKREWRFDPKGALCALLALAAPLLPYSLYVYWQTGNPVFPLYNSIFQSPYWPVVDTRLERWGPVVDDVRFKHMRAWEVLLWPLLQPFRVEHTAGDLGPHWGRISVAFLAALGGLVWRGADGRVRALSFVTAAGALLWSAASGMLRYASYLELTGGVIALYLALALARRAEGAAPPHALKRLAAVLILSTLAAQAAASAYYGYRFEWGGRPTVFQSPRAHLGETRQLLRDRSPRDYLTAKERALFDGAGVWVESGPLTSGLQALLTPDAPQWCLYMQEYFNSNESRERFARALAQARGKKIYSLCLTEDFRSATDNIRAAGLGVGRVTGVSLPYFSRMQKFHASFLIEVLPPGANDSPRGPQVTEADAPLPDTAFRAALRWSDEPPATLRAGERTLLRVAVRNEANTLWPALGRAGGAFRLFLGNHWLAPDGARLVVNDDGRAPLPHDLMPGEEASVELAVTAPREPGDYILEVDMLQEGAAWFGLKGSHTLRARLRVED